MSSKGSHEEAHGRYLAALSLTALGIVFGDIGTSPIYALRESFHSANGIDPTQANVLGVLSLILWSLIIVISIKYLTFVMRADNNGEGGIIALTALVTPPSQDTAQRARCAGDGWPLRCGTPVRRQHDHPGDLGPECH